jgi:hypothetical protein
MKQKHFIFHLFYNQQYKYENAVSKYKETKDFPVKKYLYNIICKKS